MIELPDLSELMLEEEAPPEPEPQPEPEPAPAAEDKPKRRRRSKAEMEAARAAEAQENKPDEPVVELNGNPLPPMHLPPSVNYEQEPLPIDEPEHQDAAARLLGYQSAEQRDRILAAEKEGRTNGAAPESLPDFEKAFGPEEVPDAPDAQVLTDEIHLLREDLRDLCAEIRKLTLAVDRLREREEAPKSRAGD